MCTTVIIGSAQAYTIRSQCTTYTTDSLNIIVMVSIQTAIGLALQLILMPLEPNIVTETPYTNIGSRQHDDRVRSMPVAQSYWRTTYELIMSMAGERKSGTDKRRGGQRYEGQEYELGYGYVSKSKSIRVLLIILTTVSIQLRSPRSKWYLYALHFM
jgi:hypothetical protein